MGGLFLLFGNSPDNPARMSISDDGLTWKAAISEVGDAHSDPFDGGGTIRSVAYGNGVYVGVGNHYYSGESDLGAVFRSTNGYNWRRVFRLALTSTNTRARAVEAVAFAAGRFMAVADLGTLLTSTNGADWTEIQPIVDPGNTNSVWMTRNLQGIGYGPAGWIITSTASDTALQSSDGQTWNVITATGLFTGWQPWQSFYAEGNYWFSDIGYVFTTPDGSAWTQQSAVPGPVSRAPDGVNPLYLGAGSTSDNSLVLSSIVSSGL